MKNSQRIFNIFLLAAAVVCLIGALLITPLSELTVESPGGYPVFIGILCVVFAVWVTVEEFRKKEKVEISKFNVFNKDALANIGLLILYFVSIIFLHYTIATLLYCFLAILYLNDRNWKVSSLASFISTFMILLVFKYIFSVILP